MQNKRSPQDFAGLYGKQKGRLVRLADNVMIPKLSVSEKRLISYLLMGSTGLNGPTHLQIPPEKKPN